MIIIFWCKVSPLPAQGGVLFQFDTLGNLKWSKPAQFVNNILADKFGNCFVLTGAAGGVVHKYNSAGTLLWSSKSIDQFPRGAFVQGDSLFVAGSSTINGEEHSVYTILSAGTGDTIEQRSFNLYSGEELGRERFSHITSDGANIYLAGFHGIEDTECFLVKLSNPNIKTGVPEQSLPLAFSVFPNPAEGRFTIAHGGYHIGNGLDQMVIAVRNTIGQIIFRQQSSIAADGSEWTIDVGIQPKGIYLVEVSRGEERWVKKLVLQ